MAATQTQSETKKSTPARRAEDNKAEEAQPIAEKVKEVGEQLEDMATRNAQAVREIAREGAVNTSQAMSDLAAQSEDFVKKNPALAVAGALGVGVLIGMAMRNRY
ncbi:MULTISPECIES: hypothetical protein [Phaeobacter]|uniref:hypothetical protein n=1 Tax=Phaeobacter TaxID=302485 RepID=UPI00059089BB|nr:MULTISPECIES: hypothetical protein [Phaeobacter]KII16022.1 hypothetical protein OO25_08440 [Phaeobacter sp. S60]UTS81502.1 hypothetical protein OL67_002588 [Phaeobacter piscinae]